MSAPSTAVGVAMMIAGVLQLGYVVLLDLADVRATRWYERPLLLAPAALLLVLLGGLLSAG